MIGETGMVDIFDVSLSSSFIRNFFIRNFFLMKLELSETSKISTIPVSPISAITTKSKIFAPLFLYDPVGAFDLDFVDFTRGR